MDCIRPHKLDLGGGRGSVPCVGCMGQCDQMHVLGNGGVCVTVCVIVCVTVCVCDCVCLTVCVTVCV